MVMLRILIRGLGRLLSFGGALSCAVGVLMLLLAPAGLSERLGGWFLSVGAIIALLALIARYIGARLDDAFGSLNKPPLVSNDDEWFDAEGSSASPMPDRSGIFGGDYHRDQLAWRLMMNSQERGW